MAEKTCILDICSSEVYKLSIIEIISGTSLALDTVTYHYRHDFRLLAFATLKKGNKNNLSLRDHT